MKFSIEQRLPEKNKVGKKPETEVGRSKFMELGF